MNILIIKNRLVTQAFVAADDAVVSGDGKTLSFTVDGAAQTLPAGDDETFRADPEGRAGIGFTVARNGALVPPAHVQPELPPPTLADYRAECARRILARASASTQANMNAYAAVLGLKSSLTTAETADKAAFMEAIAWVGAMRARWPELAAQSLDPRDDANWPVPTAAAIALAARF